MPRPPRSTLFPYTTLFRSVVDSMVTGCDGTITSSKTLRWLKQVNCSTADRKSTRLNSSHVRISYAVFCLKKKKLALTLRSCGLRAPRRDEDGHDDPVHRDE